MNGVSSSAHSAPSSNSVSVRKPSKFKPALSNLTNKTSHIASSLSSTLQKPGQSTRTPEFIDLSSDSSPSSPGSRALKRDSSELSILAIDSPPLKRMKKPQDQREFSSVSMGSGPSNKASHPPTAVQHVGIPSLIAQDLTTLPLDVLNYYRTHAFGYYTSFSDDAFEAIKTGDTNKDMILLERLKDCVRQRKDEIEAAIKVVKGTQQPQTPHIPTIEPFNPTIVDPGPSRSGTDTFYNNTADNVNRQLPTPSSADDDDQVLWDNLEQFDMPMHEEVEQPAPPIAPATNPICPLEPSLLRKSPYYKELNERLRTVFGLQDFRMNQLAAITAAMEGRDVFVLMPTGGGKSLCYQLPGVCEGGRTRGLTVVISPLISLMKDQVNALVRKGVSAICSNSEGQIAGEWQLVQNAQLWYLTPEKLRSSQSTRSLLSNLYAKGKLARFVIDEAHCISTWGQDFREAYTYLGDIRTEYPSVPIMALTATANAKTVADIVTQLKLQEGHVSLSQSFNRPNLRYVIRKKEKGKNHLNEIIETIKANYMGQTGIIYCLSRNNCEKVAQKLQESGISAAYYHAGMQPVEKDKVTQDWQDNTTKIIVATIAFGMGIDKPDVRFVIHHDMPKTLSGYYQETGRAGRDQQDADCIMYYSYKDLSSLVEMIRKDDNATQDSIRRQTDAVKEVFAFCENCVHCRRVLILDHFDEKFNKEDCRGRCDTCVDPQEVQLTDVWKYAVEATKLVQSLENSTGLTENHMQDILRGAKKSEVRQRGWDTLPQYGACAQLSHQLFETMIHKLLLNDVLGKNAVRNGSGFHTDYLKLGEGYQIFSRQNEYIVKWRDRSATAAGGSKRRNQANQPDPVTASAPRGRKGKNKAPEIEEDPIEMYADDSFDQTDVSFAPTVAPTAPPVSVRPAAPPIVRPVAPPIAIPAHTNRVPPSPATVRPPAPRNATPVPVPAPIPAPVPAFVINAAPDPVDPHYLLYTQLRNLRSEILVQDNLDNQEDVFSTETLQMIAAMCPPDYREFINVLVNCGDSTDEAESRFLAYGQRFLDLCLQSKIAGPGPSRPMPHIQPVTPAVLHSRFDYRAPAPHTPNNNHASASGVTMRTSKFKPAKS